MAVSLGVPIVANIILPGCSQGTGKMPIDMGEVEKEMEATFLADKDELNLKALNLGVQAVQPGGLK